MTNQPTDFNAALARAELAKAAAALLTAQHRFNGDDVVRVAARDYLTAVFEDLNPKLARERRAKAEGGGQ